MATELVKVHTLKEIQDIAKNYKLCTIEDMNGKKITTWNNIKKPVKEHLADCLSRLKLDIYPNGYYQVCFAQAVRFQKDHSEKYIICKGTPPSEPPQYNPQQNKNGMNDNKNDLLSVTSALNYITQIAELKTENNRLTMENKQLKDEIAVLEADLEEYEREDGLAEGNKTTDTMQFLKEQGPTLMNALDRYFELQDKKLVLEEKKIDKGLISNPKKNVVRREVKKFEPGSVDHLNYIRLLYKEQKEDLMNKEIDKLELLAPEQYQAICTELNLFEDENENTEQN